MAKEYKVDINRTDCIGCGACVVTCKKLFVLAQDGKSTFVGCKKLSETEIDKKYLKCAKDAAEGCPVKVIHITDLKTKKKII